MTVFTFPATSVFRNSFRHSLPAPASPFMGPRNVIRSMKFATVQWGCASSGTILRTRNHHAGRCCLTQNSPARGDVRAMPCLHPQQQAAADAKCLLDPDECSGVRWGHPELDTVWAHPWSFSRYRRVRSPAASRPLADTAAIHEAENCPARWHPGVAVSGQPMLCTQSTGQRAAARRGGVVSGPIEAGNRKRRDCGE